MAESFSAFHFPVLHSPMLFHPRRALVLALAVSLTAHAVLLFGVIRAQPPRLSTPAVAIEVVALGRTGLREAPVGETAASKALPEAQSEPRSEPAAVEEMLPRVDPPSPVRAARTDRRKTAPVPSRTRNVLTRQSDPDTATVFSPPAPEVVADVPVPAMPARPDMTSLSGGTVGETAVPKPGMSSGSGPVREDQTGGDELARYRSALAANARRFKRYPPLARERGWEGSVEVSLDFGRPGEPVFSLLTSSGKEILDEQALETLRQAIRRTELPASLKGRSFRIRQEFVFSLEDEG
jgi:protein TonB